MFPLCRVKMCMSPKIICVNKYNNSSVFLDDYRIGVGGSKPLAGWTDFFFCLILSSPWGWFWMARDAWRTLDVSLQGTANVIGSYRMWNNNWRHSASIQFETAMQDRTKQALWILLTLQTNTIIIAIRII